MEASARGECFFFGVEDMSTPYLSALIQESKGRVDISYRLSYCTAWGVTAHITILS